MEYPKKIMKVSELQKIGFKKDFLLEAYRKRGQNFARKLNPTKSNSHIIFDTEEFEKWLKRTS